MSYYSNVVNLFNLQTFCWFVRGRIKEKISAIYAIKYQVYCMENIVQWSANTVVILILVCNQYSKQPPLISLHAYVYS